MGYMKEEQETSLVWDSVDNKWIGYSCYPPHITKILKILGIDNVQAEFEEGRESPLAIKFEMKSNQISFRQGKKKEMSEEHKEKLRENAKKMAEARKKKNS